jgi:hypothetical protein
VFKRNNIIAGKIGLDDNKLWLASLPVNTTGDNSTAIGKMLKF